jgi:hypothetical protein
MDVVDERFYVREGSGVRDGTAIGIEAALPSGIDIDVLETLLLKTGGGKGIGLRHNVGLSEEGAVDGLLAESAPAEVRFLANIIHLRLSSETRQEQTAGEEKRQGVFARPDILSCTAAVKESR